MSLIHHIGERLQDAESSLDGVFNHTPAGPADNGPQPAADAAAGNLFEQLRRDRRWLLLILVLLAIQISPWWYTTKDGGAYLTVARDMVRGDADIPPGSSASVVPPGYPWLISAAFLTGDRPFLLISMIHCLFGMVFAVGVYLWSKRIFPRAAVLITCLCTLNAAVWFYYRRTLKELAFMAIVIWVVLLMERIRRTVDVRQVLLPTFLCSGLLILASLMRFSAVLFAAGMGIALLCDAARGRTGWMRAVIVTLCIGIPASGAVLNELFQQRVQHAEHGGASYEAGFQHQPKERVDVTLRWICNVTRVTIPGMLKADCSGWSDPATVVYIFVGLLVAAGWCRLVWTRQDIWALTLPMYVVLYMAWPFDQGARFAVPLLPILLLCHWATLERWFRYPLTIATASLCLHVAVAFGYWALVDAPRAQQAHLHWQLVDELIVDVDSGAVQTRNLPSPLAVMCQHSLKRVVRCSDGEWVEIPTQIEWLIQPSALPVMTGFEPQKTVDGFVLLRRSAEFDKGIIVSVNGTERF